MESLKSFEELNCWKEALLLRQGLKAFLNGLPKQEEYRLKDQLTRCLRSLTNNIGEGYGRFHYQENIQYCRISRGSLYEIFDHLLIAVEEKYIDIVEFDLQKNQILKCVALLNGYINYLNKAKKTTN